MGTHTRTTAIVFLMIVFSAHGKRMNTGSVVNALAGDQQQDEMETNAATNSQEEMETGAAINSNEIQGPGPETDMCKIDLAQMYAELTPEQISGADRGGTPLRVDLGQFVWSMSCTADAVRQITRQCLNPNPAFWDNADADVSACKEATLADYQALWEVLNEIDMFLKEALNHEGQMLDDVWGKNVDTKEKHKEGLRENRANFCTSCCEYQENRGEGNELGRNELSVKVVGKWTLQGYQHSMRCQASPGTTFQKQHKEKPVSCNRGYWRKSTFAGSRASDQDCWNYCRTSCGTGGGRKSIVLPEQGLTQDDPVFRGNKKAYQVYLCERSRGHWLYGGGYIGGTVSGHAEYCLIKVYGVTWWLTAGGAIPQEGKAPSHATQVQTGTGIPERKTGFSRFWEIYVEGGP